jgi:hypothetical protein
MNMKRYFVNVLISIDQLGNTLFGGDPDEVISSRLGKIQQRFGGKIPWRYPLPKLIAFGLDRLEPGHCIGAIEEDEGKNQLTDI